MAALDSVTTLSRATDVADTAEKQCEPIYPPKLVWNKRQWDAQRAADMQRFVHRYLDLLKIAQAHRGKVAAKTLKFLRTFRRRVVLAVNRASVPVQEQRAPEPVDGRCVVRHRNVAVKTTE